MYGVYVKTSIGLPRSFEGNLPDKEQLASVFLDLCYVIVAIIGVPLTLAEPQVGGA